MHQRPAPDDAQLAYLYFALKKIEKGEHPPLWVELEPKEQERWKEKARKQNWVEAAKARLQEEKA